MNAQTSAPAWRQKLDDLMLWDGSPRYLLPELRHLRESAPEEAADTIDAAIATCQARHRRQRLESFPLASEAIEAIAQRNVRETEAIAIARQWLAQRADRPRPWLLMLGAVGVGKTFAAGYILANARREGRVYRAAALVRTVFPGYSEQRTPLDAPLAILEDLGVEPNEPRLLSALGEFVEARLSLPTVVTSNLGVAELKARYGARLCDRWNDCGIIVELSGKSLRRQDGGL